MTPPSTESPDVRGGSHDRTPNRALLGEVASLLARLSWVDGVSTFPANRPDSVYCDLVVEHYPKAVVSAANLEIQAYTNGDFHISYIEIHHGSRYLVRWDRHDSPDYPRDHFHAPPAATHDSGQPRAYPPGLFEVLSDVVAPWIYERVGSLWDESDG